MRREYNNFEKSTVQEPPGHLPGQYHHHLSGQGSSHQQSVGPGGNGPEYKLGLTKSQTIFSFWL